MTDTGRDNVQKEGTRHLKEKKMTKGLYKGYMSSDISTNFSNHKLFYSWYFLILHVSHVGTGL